MNLLTLLEHKVAILDDDDMNTVATMATWCGENLEKSPIFRVDNHKGDLDQQAIAIAVFIIENENDQLAFKLKWM